MERRIITFLILCLLPPLISAKSERGADQYCTPRVPSIDYEKAISIARVKSLPYFVENESFIDQVNLVCIERKYIWAIGFRRKSYESGHFIVNVSMDGSTKIALSKDG